MIARPASAGTVWPSGIRCPADGGGSFVDETGEIRHNLHAFFKGHQLSRQSASMDIGEATGYIENVGP